MLTNISEELIRQMQNIRLAVFDVDGVLTDGKLNFLPDGSEIKNFNTLDGLGIKMLQKQASRRQSSLAEAPRRLKKSQITGHCLPVSGTGRQTHRARRAVG
ncbi:hypothetical protein [Aliamphritea spongicola]